MKSRVTQEERSKTSVEGIVQKVSWWPIQIRAKLSNVDREQRISRD